MIQVTWSCLKANEKESIESKRAVMGNIRWDSEGRTYPEERSSSVLTGRKRCRSIYVGEAENWESSHLIDIFSSSSSHSPLHYFCELGVKFLSRRLRLRVQQENLEVPSHIEELFEFGEQVFIIVALISPFVWSLPVSVRQSGCRHGEDCFSRASVLLDTWDERMNDQRNE